MHICEIAEEAQEMPLICIKHEAEVQGSCMPGMPEALGSPLCPGLGHEHRVGLHLAKYALELPSSMSMAML